MYKLKLPSLQDEFGIIVAYDSPNVVVSIYDHNNEEPTGYRALLGRESMEDLRDFLTSKLMKEENNY